MTELPEDIQRAFAELPREREPDPALEERVVRAVFVPQRRWWYVAAAAAAAVLLLAVTHPWSSPQAMPGREYVLLLSEAPPYLQPSSAAVLLERQHEYGHWADSLDHLGKLVVEGHLGGQGTLDGLFIIRAANDAEAAAIAASCPHNKYRGQIEVREFIP